MQGKLVLALRNWRNYF